MPNQRLLRMHACRRCAAEPYTLDLMRGNRMNIGATRRATLLAIYVLSFGCQRQTAEKEAPPFRIVATDAGFEAPDRLAAGLRHIVFENRGSEIHEAMLVKLVNGMSADDYMAAVKKGSLFPQGALDYSGPGLTSPGQTAEMWLKVDPGQYIIICWNEGHAKTTPLHSFTVEEVRLADDRPPKEDLVLKLFDYRFELDRAICTEERTSSESKPLGRTCMRWTFTACTTARPWQN